jgi:protein-tyrosine-phosphatase
LKRVLVVCTGNTCRSPMAEGWLNAKLAGKGWLAESAGVAAWGGSPASPEAVEAMREIGVDISGHSSRGLSRERMAAADYILVMTHGHRSEMVRRFPDAKDKIFLVHGFSPDGERDVMDPMGFAVEVYRRTRDEMIAALGDFLVHLAERGELSSE